MMNNYKAVPKKIFGINQRVILLSLLAAVLSALSPLSLAAQGKSPVTGVVNDETGAPMAGVNVVLKGTLTGTVTGGDGSFSINTGAETDPVLTFSYLGYFTQDISVGARSFVTVSMEQDVNLLDDVVVVGYGSMTKKEISSSIVQINSEDFHKGAIGSAMELVSGKVAGLNVNKTAFGNPNSSAGIQVRGAASLSAGNEPLVIIDGVAMGYGDYNLRSISPMDIESITVLKDASSAAIYGSRSANGVILVTTKKGSSSETANITYNGGFTVNTAANLPEILSADEFRRSMRRNDYGASTDWYRALIRDFSYDTSHQISINGAKGNGSYNASLDFRDATGIDIASGRREYGARAAISQKALNNIVELNASVSARKVTEEWGDDGMFDTALTMNPTMPIYDESQPGGFYHPTSPLYVRNPVESLTAEKRGGERIYVMGIAQIKVNLFNKGKHALDTSLNYSFNYNDLYQYNWSPTTSSESLLWSEYKGRSTLEYNKWWTNQAEWLVNYSYVGKDHTVRAVAGYSFSQDDHESRWMENRGFEYDQFEWHAVQNGSALADGTAGVSSGKDRKRLVGVFGRVNYSWKNIVMASASLRYEGATVFGANNKWGYFPAGSAAVEFANLSAMSPYKDIVNSLKLRVSYGVAGRSNFGLYRSLSTYGAISPDANRGWRYPVGDEWVQAYGPTKNANPDLGWEKAADFNIGVDFAFLNRLRGSVEFYSKRSIDLLYDYTAPQPPFIYPSMYVNVGTINNRGVELSLEGDIFKNKDFGWTMGIIGSYGKTKFSKLSGNGYYATEMWLYQLPGIGTSEHLFRVAEGGYVGNFWGYEHAGVDDNGYLMIYDKENNMVPITAAKEEDKRFIGNGAPKFYYSWTNDFRFKNFDLNLFFRGAAGFKAFNFRKYNMGLMGAGTDNVLREAYTKNSDITREGNVISSFYLEDASYIKLESVTLGYNFNFKPDNKFLSGIRVYFTAKNLFTLTGYTGNDPSILGVNGLTPSVDTGSAYPYARQFSIGVSINFK